MRAQRRSAIVGSLLFLAVAWGAPTLYPGGTALSATAIHAAANGRLAAGASPVYDVGALAADLRQMREALERMHPAMYGLTDKATFDRLFDQAASQIVRPMALPRFFRVAAPIVARVGCGHTALSAPDGYFAAASDRYLPIRFATVGSHVYVRRTAGEAAFLPPGSEILAINGLAVTEILARIKAAMSFDVEDGPARLLASWERFEGWPFYDLLALLIGTPETFTVSHLPPGGTERRDATLPAVTRSALSALMGATSIPGRDPGLAIDKRAGTAVLTIRSFAYSNNVERFKALVDGAINDILASGVEHLIIDLRGNGGGDPFCAAHLLGYLLPLPAPYFARAYPGYDALAVPIPIAAHRFAGRLSILIDGGCFSTTGHFCALLRYHRLGVFVGSETGATYECNDASETITLANTGLRLRVARRTYTVAVQDMPRRRGIVPDHEVHPSLEDILNGRDAVLEFARTR